MAWTINGPWNQAETEEFLRGAAMPMRLSCTGGDGYPRVVSIWFALRDGRIQGVTHRESDLANLLENNHRVGFEIAPNEPPYHGVRGQGDATLSPLGDDPLLQDLIEHYLGSTDSKLAQWLLSRREEEVVISIEPRRLFSWDYRERMSGEG